MALTLTHIEVPGEGQDLAFYTDGDGRKWAPAILTFVDGEGDPQSVTASVPLPVEVSGVATEAEQQTQTTALQAIAAGIGDLATVTEQQTQTGHLSDLADATTAADGSGSDAGKAIVIAGEYNATPPTFEDGKQVPLQTDEEGNLRVTSPVGAATESEQQTQTSHLETIDTNVGVVTSAVVEEGSEVSGTSKGILISVRRVDTPSEVPADDGESTFLQVDQLGRLEIVDMGARSAVVDSISTVPGVPPGATPFQVHYTNTGAHGAGAAQSVFDPPSGHITVVTDIMVSTDDGPGGKGIFFFAADADATYDQGTDVPISVFTLIPSEENTPGFIDHPTTPPRSTTANHQIKYQSADALEFDALLRGYTFEPPA